jgi:hypothetical protein
MGWGKGGRRIKITIKIEIKIGIFGLFDGEDDLVEQGAGTAMGGDDGKLTAPHGDRFGDPIEKSLIGVKSKFVKGNMTALTREGVGVGGEGINAATIGELQDVGGAVGSAVKEEFAQIAEADFHHVRPIATIVELEPGLMEIAGGDVGVEAGAAGADDADQAVTVAPGKAGLAGFDEDFERGIVLNPVALGFVEELVGNGHF